MEAGCLLSGSRLLPSVSPVGAGNGIVDAGEECKPRRWLPLAVLAQPVIVWSAPSGRESSCLNFSISLRGACGVPIDQFCLAVVGRIETSRV